MPREVSVTTDGTSLTARLRTITGRCFASTRIDESDIRVVARTMPSTMAIARSSAARSTAPEPCVSAQDRVAGLGRGHLRATNDLVVERVRDVGDGKGDHRRTTGGQRPRQRLGAIAEFGGDPPDPRRGLDTVDGATRRPGRRHRWLPGAPAPPSRPPPAAPGDVLAGARPGRLRRAGVIRRGLGIVNGRGSVPWRTLGHRRPP